jgi:hypothetical protein
LKIDPRKKFDFYYSVIENLNLPYLISNFYGKIRFAKKSKIFAEKSPTVKLIFLIWKLHFQVGGGKFLFFLKWKNLCKVDSLFCQVNFSRQNLKIQMKNLAGKKLLSKGTR